MPKPTFLKATAELEKWREQFNPLRGLTMRRLSTLLEEADRGVFANVMWLLRKVERRDETVRACKQRMTSELARLEWRIGFPAEPPPGAGDAQIEAQKDFLRARYDAVDNLKAALQFLALADLRGFAHVEKHYGKDGLPHHLECVPQWHWMKDGIYGDWKFDAKATGFETLSGTAIEREHFIVREVDDPWFEIALIKAQRKSLGDKDFDGFVESYGIPWMFFIAPPGAGADKLAEFQAIADEIAGDGRGVLPNGSDVKGPPGSASTNAQVFKQYLDRQDAAIVLAATGGLLTVLTAPGSGTLAGSAHQEAWENVVAGVAKNVSETLQEQFDKPLLAEKFPGQPVLAWFELAYPDQPEARGDFVADVKTLKDAGFSVKREAVEEKTGLPLEPESLRPDPQAPNPKPQAPLTNRFAGGAPSARDSEEALQLAENAVANVLQVGRDYLAPLRGSFDRLLTLAESEAATAEDFAALAAEIGQSFPELLDELDVGTLAAEIEQAMGSAAVMGARAALRSRGAVKHRKRKAKH